MKDKFLAHSVRSKEGGEVKENRERKKAPDWEPSINVVIFRTLTLKGIGNLLLKLWL